MTPLRSRAALVVLLLVFAAPTAAMTEAPYPGEPTGDPTDPAPTVDITITVTEPDADGVVRPVANHEVLLHILTGSHTVSRTERATSDAEGIARFSIAPVLGAEAVAELNLNDSGGRRYFSDPILLGDPGDRSATVAAALETTDRSVVRATSVQTIVEPWEGYVTITQVWNLTTDGPIYNGTMEDPSTFLRIPLPEGAEGIRVTQPAETHRVIGTTVALTVEVAPPELTDQRGGHITLQFSLKTDNAHEVEWSQLLPMPVEDFSVVVPQSSTFAKHPTLDVTIDGPSCPIEGPDAATTFCFDTFDGEMGGMQLRDDIPMRIARGRGAAGQTVHVITRGWPSRTRWAEKGAIAAGALAVLVFGFLLLRDRRVRAASPSARRMTELEAQRDALFAAAAELDQELDEGRILQRDHDVARERIRHQLGVLYRRMRELNGSEPSERE